MEDRKNVGGFLAGQIPFIANLKYMEPNVPTKDIDANGIYGTKEVDRVNVNVETAEELTPEAQQEILNEEY